MNMLIYLIVAVLLFYIELLYFRIAKHYNIVDKPNSRSSHAHVTLRGGGIIFPIGILIWAIAFGFVYPWFIGGLTIISIISFMDDIHPLPDSIRLVFQFISIIMMFNQVGVLKPEAWWLIILILILCVGILNAYNFMDGINGITGGYSLAVLFPLILMNTAQPFINMPLLVISSLSVLVFCLFNFRKHAKCFAGDIGAVSMAFIIVFALIMLVIKTKDFTYIIFLAVYGIDTVLTICHRLLLHENLGIAHRKHAYQLMANELNISHVKVSLIYTILQLLISLGLIFLPVNHLLYSIIVLMTLSGTYILFMKKYYHLHDEYLRTLKN